MMYVYCVRSIGSKSILFLSSRKESVRWWLENRPGNKGFNGVEVWRQREVAGSDPAKMGSDWMKELRWV